MKIYFVPAIVLLFVFGCKKDELQIADLESSLPGKWNIESIKFNSLYLETTYMGKPIEAEEVINNVGVVEFDEFEYETLLLNSDIRRSLPFKVEIDTIQFNFEIEYLSTNAERYFGAFRMLENNNLTSEYGQFLETTLLFDLNSNFTINDEDELIIEAANGDHIINLTRLQ